MSVLPIVQFPNPILSTVCTPVTEITEEIRTLASDMAQTMYEAPGVGLAAPQVGHAIRLIVLDVSENKDNLITLINPEIIATSDEWVCGEEGCLSLPGIWEKVDRHAQVTVKYTDLDGKVFVDHLSRLKYDRACAKLKKRRLQEKHRN